MEELLKRRLKVIYFHEGGGGSVGIWRDRRETRVGTDSALLVKFNCAKLTKTMFNIQIPRSSDISISITFIILSVDVFVEDTHRCRRLTESVLDVS